jgi:hypothetical protein
MTNKQINAEIAEVCGWTDIFEHPEFGLMGVESETHGCRTAIENYTHDLNAMHEAEKTLTGLNCHAFCEWLLDIVADSPDHLWEVLTASSRQRAEAFLKTLGKWEEAE